MNRRRYQPFSDDAKGPIPVGPAVQHQLSPGGPMSGLQALGFTSDESGQDLAEYALLIGLIAIVVIGAVTAFGGGLVGLFNNIVATLPFGS
jgi:pilus assembly protein Flp/PilA